MIDLTLKQKQRLGEYASRSKDAPAQIQAILQILELEEQYEDLKKEVSFLESKFASIFPTVDVLNDKLKNITLKKGDPGKDGEDYILTEEDKKEIAASITVPVVEKIVEKVETIREIPQVTETIVKEIKEVEVFDEKKLPQYAVYYRDALELLPEGEKLRIEAIENLRKELDEIRALRSVGKGGAVTDKAVQFALMRSIQAVTPTGTIDGANTDFEVPSTIHAVLSFELNSRVVALGEYSIIGGARKTIRFDTAPSASYSGKSFVITYI